jgi:PAS domain S-box-containing protein
VANRENVVVSGNRWGVPSQQIASVALVLGVTVAGVIAAHMLGEREARRNSEQRAEVAAAQIRGRIDQGISLVESLRRFVAGSAAGGVRSEDFAGNASRWLSPGGFPAAAWVQKVPASQRAAYERRIGRPIVTRDGRGRILPVGSRSTYLPATLVSGVPPMAVPAIDLGGEAGMAAALARTSSRRDTRATPLSTLRDRTAGFFLVEFAPRVSNGRLETGFVVVFVSEMALRAVTDTATVQVTTGGGPTRDGLGGNAVRSTFTEAGQRFDVVVPRSPVQNAAAAMPWIILAGGLVLAALAEALGVHGARRARAQAELDRIFTLTPDLITVADFDGYFKRVNPAVRQVLGYTEEEILARPYLELVHPDDRRKTAAKAAAVRYGRRALSFENRVIAKDGAPRVLEWTATRADDRLIYGVARDVTERRQAEIELRRLADEHAALRRVATLVAKGVSAGKVFAAVAEELARLLEAQATAMGRLEADGTMTIVASSGTAPPEIAPGARLKLEPGMILAEVIRTGRAARIDYCATFGTASTLTNKAGVGCAVAVPIVVEGSLWGSLGAATARDPFPPDAEQRVAEFTELAGAAIANAESRSALTASRARVVAASDRTRRRIERDLHDGAQQRLVHTVITLKLARQALEAGDEAVPALVADALAHAQRATDELRELVQGILPPVLTRSGLHAAVRELASRTPVPVELDVAVGRFDAAVEATAYFVVAESLTNVAKHSDAAHATVIARIENRRLQLDVRDDGVGGAQLDGSGLMGLADRLAAIEGQLRVESPPGAGTLVAASIPLVR